MNERIWNYLNSEGIYTKEDLHQRILDMPKINIGIFTKIDKQQIEVKK